jgi:hypothetical protein
MKPRRERLPAALDKAFDPDPVIAVLYGLFLPIDIRFTEAWKWT